jgi:hypothetical protein
MAKHTVLAKGPTFRLISKAVGCSGQRGDFVLTVTENGSSRKMTGMDFSEACELIQQHLDRIQGGPR